MDVLERTVYSPIPEVPPPGHPTWKTRASQLHHLFDAETQLRFVADLRPHIEEFDAAMSRSSHYRLWNGLYQAGDAETLFAIIRNGRPRRVVEVGSGFSTYVITAAAERNRNEGDPVDVVAIDPEPRIPIEATDAVVRFERSDCRDFPLEQFESLEAGDILFIDTSHSVKLGSEVNWLFLEVLPRLRTGVRVHIHDVFLPYEYPRYLFEFGSYFNEQYLLQALLTENVRWEVSLSMAFLFKERRDTLIQDIPSLAEAVPGMPSLAYVPAAFWIRRR